MSVTASNFRTSPTGTSATLAEGLILSAPPSLTIFILDPRVAQEFRERMDHDA